MTRKRARNTEDKQEVVRQNYLLRTGGTISADDYDEDKHVIIEETDDQYTQRMESAPNGRAPGPMHPRTTIANLHTYDSTQVGAPAQPVAGPPVLSTIPDAKPVATSDEPNTNLLDPNNRDMHGRMNAPQVATPVTDDEDASDEDDTNDSDDE